MSLVVRVIDYKNAQIRIKREARAKYTYHLQGKVSETEALDCSDGTFSNKELAIFEAKARWDQEVK